MNPLVIIGLGIVGLILLSTRKKKTGKKPVQQVQQLSTQQGSGKMYTKNDSLGKNFTAAEFLTSSVYPELINRTIPETVWNNMLRLVNLVLQPARDRMGVPFKVTSGWRPEGVLKDGKTFFDLLTEAGEKPAKDSDHYYGLAAGIYPVGKDLAESTVKGIELYKMFQENPNVRQVILYLKQDAQDGDYTLGHIHVSVMSPNRPKILPTNRSFIMVNNVRTDEFTS